MVQRLIEANGSTADVTFGSFLLLQPLAVELKKKFALPTLPIRSNLRSSALVGSIDLHERKGGESLGETRVF